MPGGHILSGSEHSKQTTTWISPRDQGSKEDICSSGARGRERNALLGELPKAVGLDRLKSEVEFCNAERRGGG
jgi:hypothetical protein